MNNAEVIKGLEDVIGGLNRIKDALVTGGNETEDEVKVSKVTKTPADNPSLEELEKMGYNEFKKYAASLGVKCTGSRDKIMERVLEALEIEGSPKSSEPVEDEAPAPKKAKKSSADEFDKQAEEIAKDTDLEDILEALSDVDVEADEDNYIEKLAFALREGLLSLDGEDEADESVDSDESGEDDSDEGEEISPKSYFADFDPEGLNDPETLSKKRAKAVEKKMKEILEAVDSEELSLEDIESYVDDNATDDEKELLPDDYTESDLLALYMELVKRTIDNDGEEHEPSDPYEIGEENLCCGHVLKYSKSTKKYICEICGTEYEAE